MKTLIPALALMVLAAITAPAMATPITITSPGAYHGADVGSIDSLYGYGKTANSGKLTEIAFMNALTGETYTSTDFNKFCDAGACGGMLLDTSMTGVYAIHLATAPAFFMIKTGNGSSLAQPSGSYACSSKCEHFVFENLGNTSFLVFSMTDMGFGATATGKISHIDSFGLAATSVPEPGILGMFGVGTGLVGLFLGVRRRRVQ